MSALARSEMALDARGGGIPCVRLIPLIDEWEAKNGPAGGRDNTLARRIYKLRYETDTVSFEFADRILVEIGLEHEWHDRLSDLYGDPEPEAPTVDRTGQGRFLSHEQIRAAERLHNAGWSVTEIARRSWQKLGYSSVNSCKDGLLSAFRAYGIARRDHSQRRLALVRGCRGCGGPLSERTPSCNACEGRHRKRRREGTAPHKEATCSGCGGRYDDLDTDCSTCLSRHAFRRQRTKRGPALDGPASLNPRPSSRGMRASTPSRAGEGRGRATPPHKPRRPLPVGTSADASDQKEGT